MLSIIDNIGARELGIELDVFSIPKYVEKMRKRVSEKGRAVSFPFKEVGPDEDRLARILSRSGLLRPLIKPIAERYVRLTPHSESDDRAIDDFLKAQQIDVVHFGYAYNYRTTLPFIYEPHDVQHKTYPEFFTADELRWRDIVYGRGIASASFVVCGTRWTRNNIIEKFNVPPHKVAAIPRSSVHARLELDVSVQNHIAARLRLPQRFAYYPAMTFPHKNHLRLFQAIAILRERHGLKLNLVCTGRPFARHHPVLLEEITRLGLQDQVMLLGRVTEEELVVAFQRAEMIVFPSLFEGLSQSLLESLALGKPIVAANQSSIPETVGDAALLFDGLVVGSMVDALLRAMSRPDEMQSLVDKARRQMARYDWGAASVKLAACYKSAAGRPLSEAEAAALKEATS